MLFYVENKILHHLFAILQQKKTAKQTRSAVHFSSSYYQGIRSSILAQSIRSHKAPTESALRLR